jgi:hypothetical protein
MAEHRGGCHCGNLRLNLRLTQPPEDVRLRACGCSFCRAHNTRTTSDPDGSVDIHAADWSLVERYRFDTGTAEFLICRRCGVYIGATGETDAGTRAVINTNCLEDRAAFTGQPDPVDHGGEATGARLARRAINWTPATIHRD